MAENYKLLYEQMKKMVAMYQDEIVPGMRKTIEELEQNRVEVVRCKDCKHWKFIDSLNPHWECQIFCGLHDYGYLAGADDFCSYGERRKEE